MLVFGVMVLEKTLMGEEEQGIDLEEDRSRGGKTVIVEIPGEIFDVMRMTMTAHDFQGNLHPSIRSAFQGLERRGEVSSVVGII